MGSLKIMALSNNDEPLAQVSNITEPSEPEEVDIIEEKVDEDSNSDFGGGSEKSDGVVSVRGEETVKDCETVRMRDNVASAKFRGVRGKTWPRIP